MVPFPWLSQEDNEKIRSLYSVGMFAFPTQSQLVGWIQCNFKALESFI